MKGAAKSGDNQWKGDLLDTDNGKTYAGVVTLEGPWSGSFKKRPARVRALQIWQRGSRSDGGSAHPGCRTKF